MRTIWNHCLLRCTRIELMYCVPPLIFLLLPTLLFCCSGLVVSPLCCIPFSLPRTAPFRSCLSGFWDSLTLSWLTSTLRLLCAMYNVIAKGLNARSLVSAHLRRLLLMICNCSLYHICLAFRVSASTCAHVWMGMQMAALLGTHWCFAQKSYIVEWLYGLDEMIQWVEDDGIPDRVLPLPGPATAPPTGRSEEAPLRPRSLKTLSNVVKS